MRTDGWSVCEPEVMGVYRPRQRPGRKPFPVEKKRTRLFKLHLTDAEAELVRMLPRYERAAVARAALLEAARRIKGM